MDITKRLHMLRKLIFCLRINLKNELRTAYLLSKSQRVFREKPIITEIATQPGAS